MDLKELISVASKESSSHVVSTLFGNLGGGQLEFVKLEMFTSVVENQYIRMVRLYFTNHDVEATYGIVNEPRLKDNRYFIVEVPIHE